MAKVKNTPKKRRSSVKKAVQKGKAAQKGSPKKKQKGKGIHNNNCYCLNTVI